jgi:hypothetical protein
MREYGQGHLFRKTRLQLMLIDISSLCTDVPFKSFVAAFVA